MADRIEREIEEILRKIDNFVPDRARGPARKVGQPFAAFQGWLVHSASRISLNQVMMWALIIFLVTALFPGIRAIPGAGWIMIGSIIVFVTAFIMSKRGSAAGRPSTQKRWRGQPLDLSGPSWPDRIKAWIKGRKHV